MWSLKSDNTRELGIQLTGSPGLFWYIHKIGISSLSQVQVDTGDGNDRVNMLCRQCSVQHVGSCETSSHAQKRESAA